MSRVPLLLVIALAANCGRPVGDRALSDTVTAAFVTNAFSAAHIVRIYVSAVNCEMNAADATRVNAMAQTAGLQVEVVFAGITNNDTLVAQRARTDLGLVVATRLMKVGELEQYKSIGSARLPMALVVKAKQLRTIVSGETMPRTLSLLEASLSPIAGQ